MEQPKVKVVIAGGGTAGWVAAAALAKQLGPLLDITLVESDQIGTIGVGEATIPTQRTFHTMIGLDERAFMRATQATFKLGIAFENWAREGDRYVHSFGTIGKSPWMTHFFSVWAEARARGLGKDLGAYCLELRAAEESKMYTDEKGGLNYAFHLDATAYAKLLRTLSEGAGVARVEGKIDRVEQNAESGDLTALVLEGGERVEGDLFLDCTGFRGLLIEETLKTGYDDWRHWLPMDRAIAVQTSATEPPVPYTRSIAHDAGWRWRIPLQKRVGNGIVYCSSFLKDEAAEARLLGAVTGERLTEPRPIRFVTGRRRKAWNKNCVTLGLSSGFIEPLESTSIHLIQIAVTRLIKLFPFSGDASALRTRFNEMAAVEMERIRDFIILHYRATERDDSPFWRHCRNMEIPGSLAERIALFEESGYAYQGPEDLFQVDSWVQVMLGQRLVPGGHHRMAGMMTDEQLAGALSGIERSVERALGQLPSHEDFIARYCPAQG
ncbi:tryptophan halogenase family protein [Parvularcula dongshanensis]|uniref:Tryptophan halogenase n=1 Tax=Parvularcula dongshanensis TaxID=1173995 RepID=A0A840I3V0_9PROT|nr:tryptophan halogenase family protein [Parvularcula dongshanensis]MBB4659457.1 tryptophan halogenase [Parvularcula dongshanensis]